MKTINQVLSSKKFIIFSVCVLLLIIGGTAYFYYQRQLPQEEQLMLPETILVEPPEGLALGLPVGDRQHLDKAIVPQTDPQNILFFLPADEPVKASFDGRIDRIFRDQISALGDDVFHQIVLHNEDDTVRIKYLFVGEILSTEGQSVKKGDILARVSEKGIFWLSDSNLVIWAYDIKANQMMRISRDLFN